MRRLWKIIVPVLVLAVVLLTAWRSTPNQPAISTDFKPAPAGSLSLITEPAAGISPEVKLINSAKKSVDLVMYELEDQQVEQALAAAQARGIAVRVLLNRGYYGQQSSANEAAYSFLLSNHVPVHWTPSYFALTHQKTLVIDGQTASIMTFNFTPQYYSTSRDFAVNDTDIHDVQAIEAAFSSDWANHKTTAPTGDDLVWSPGSEKTTINLINSAKSSLEIYNEEMADSKVETALEQAAKRNVKVEVTMTYSSSWKKDFTALAAAGVQVHTYAAKASLYIHAKMILIDGKQAFLGSENFSPTSLDDNRELGIIISDTSIIKSLNSTFNSDFQLATPYP